MAKYAVEFLSKLKNKMGSKFESFKNDLFPKSSHKHTTKTQKSKEDSEHSFDFILGSSRYASAPMGRKVKTGFAGRGHRLSVTLSKRFYV
jgi:hypothetical protein